VRLDVGNDAVDTLHDGGEVDRAGCARDAQRAGCFQLLGRLGRADQRLARHAAEVEAVAAHLVALDQRHLGFHRRGDVGGDKSAGPRTDDDEVAIEGLRLRPLRIDFAALNPADDPLRQERKDAQEHELASKAGDKMSPGDRIAAS
jgi:hypothetical protein